jgi:hypothetical protein
MSIRGIFVAGPSMRNDQAVMGAAIALVCAVGLAKSGWLFQNSRNGRRLARWFGERAGLWVLRGLLGAGTVVGVLLMLDIIRPIQW